MTTSVVQIISIRAEVEKIDLSQESLALLGDIAASTSLRYAVQLMAPAKIVTAMGERTQVSVDDIKEADSLFLDSKASAKRLIEDKGNNFTQ